MKAVAATALCMAAGATAFAPTTTFAGKAVATRATTCSAIKMQASDDYKLNMPGITAPLGFWDPAGLSESSEIGNKQMQKYREAELKHGRVAMLACVGMLVQEGFHPFFMGNEVDMGPASFHLQQVNMNFPLLPSTLLFLIGLVEAWTIGKGWSKQDYQEDGVIANLKRSYEPGDLGFDPLNLAPQDEAGYKDMKSREINNGRLAMIGIIGMWAQELVEPKTIGDWWAVHTGILGGGGNTLA